MTNKTPLQALRELREAIDTFKGHGMPGFRDRAVAYLVLQQTDEVLENWCDHCQRNHPPNCCPEQNEKFIPEIGTG